MANDSFGLQTYSSWMKEGKGEEEMQYIADAMEVLEMALPVDDVLD